MLATRAPDAMAVQKYDIRCPESEGGGFEERYWSPVNTPVLASDGTVKNIIHRVQDVTEFVRLKGQSSALGETSEELRTRAGVMEVEIIRRAQELQKANASLRTLQGELEERVEARTAALRASEGRFAKLASSGVFGIVVFESDQKILEVNDAFASLIGYTRDELLAMRPDVLSRPEEGGTPS